MADSSSDSAYEYARSKTPSPPTTHQSPPSTTHQSPPPTTHTLNLDQVPLLTWTQKLNFVLIGVWVFCSTPLLSIPFAIRETGWLGLCFFCGFMVMTFLSAWLLPNFITDERSYMDLGNTTLGATGRWIGFVISCVFSYATCIDSVMIARDNLNLLTPGGASLVLTTMVIIGLGLILWYKNFDEYDPFFPRIGVMLTLVVIGCLAYLGLSHAGFHGETQLFHYHKLHLAIGFYAYCFTGHSYLPRLFIEINNNREYRKMVIVTFVISTTLYAFTGCIAYAMYGLKVESIFTLNFPPDSTASQVAIYCTVTSHMIRYLLNMSTLATTMEERVPEERRTEKCRKTFRFVMVLSTLLAFFGTPIYAPLVSLSGSVIGVLMSLTIPSICFFIKNWGNLTPIQVPILKQGIFWILALLIGLLASGFTITRSIISI